MKLRLSAILLTMGLSCAVSYAQDSLSFSEPVPAPARDRVSFVYDVNFATRFDNREYDKGGKIFTNDARSSTIFGARVTPVVGFQVDEMPHGPVTVTRRDGTERTKESTGACHRLVMGLDIQKDFGMRPVSRIVSRHFDDKPALADGVAEETSRGLDNWKLFRDIVFYYNFQKKMGKTDFGITAGVFPRTHLGGEYGEYVFSDSLKFCDPNMEGLLLSFRRPKSYFEVGCDWMGYYGVIRRERFMIFTAGYSQLKDWLKIGYSGFMLHHAGSIADWGVVDNIQVNPYVDMNFGAFCGVQRIALNIGWIQEMQRDRRDTHGFAYPCAANIVTELRHWNAGIRNDLVVGTNLMPWYKDVDRAGVSYGARLYTGDPFYQIIPSAAAPLVVDGEGIEHFVPQWGVYDRLEAYYEPYISDYLSLKVQARFHFAGGKYMGCQQVLSLGFDLETLLEACSKKKAR